MESRASQTAPDTLPDAGRVVWCYGLASRRPAVPVDYATFADHLHRAQQTCRPDALLELLHPHRPPGTHSWPAIFFQSPVGLENAIFLLKNAAPLAVLTAIEMAPLRTAEELTNRSWRLVGNAADRFLGHLPTRLNGRGAFFVHRQIFHDAWWRRVRCRFSFVDAQTIDYGHFPRTRPSGCDFDWGWLHAWSRRHSTSPAHRTALLNTACASLASGAIRPEELVEIAPPVGDAG